MTDEQLKAIEERAAKATPGPWCWTGNMTCQQIWLARRHAWGDIVMDFVRWGMQRAMPRFNTDGILEKAKLVRPQAHNAWMISDIDHPDAQFIAHSRKDVDDLLAEVRRLRTDNERLRTALEEYGEHKETCDAMTDLAFDEMAGKVFDETECTCGLRAAIVGEEE